MTVAPEQRWAIWGREGGYCGICFEPVPYREMHLDHITPESLGGKTEPANLRPTHAKCNIGRGNGRVPRTTPRREIAGTTDYRPRLIRLPPDVEAAVADAARDSRRSFHAQLLHIVEERMDRDRRDA